MPRRPVPLPFNVTLRHLRAVSLVAEYNSFTAAAADLGMTQSGVSRLIGQVERRLGLMLFLRTTRSVIPTVPGREFVASMDRLLQDLDLQVQSARALGGQLRGRLVISCLLSLTHHLVPGALVRYRTAHSGVELHLHEGLGAEVHEDVRSGRADIGIGNVLGLSEDVVVDEQVTESCFAVIPRRHRLASLSAVALKDLAQEDLVSLPLSSGLRRQIDGVAAMHSLTLRHMTVVEQFGSLYDFVAAGLGLAIVPASAVPRRMQPGLVIKPLVTPTITRSIGILRLKNRPLSPAAKGFLEIFLPHFTIAIRR